MAASSLLMLHGQQMDLCASGQHSLDLVAYFKREDMDLGGRCVGLGRVLRGEMSIGYDQNASYIRMYCMREE